MIAPIGVGPVDLLRLMWPEARPYDKQLDMVNAVRYSVETNVVAGNQLGGCPRP